MGAECSRMISTFQARWVKNAQTGMPKSHTLKAPLSHLDESSAGDVLRSRALSSFAHKLVCSSRLALHPLMPPCHGPRHLESCSLTKSSMSMADFSMLTVQTKRGVPRRRGLRVFYARCPMAVVRVRFRPSQHCAPCGRGVWGDQGPSPRSQSVGSSVQSV